jgi:glycosyltransferase involved in cell wall biosynthesis
MSNAEYWVVGDGPEQERLRALAEELGIAHQTKFWGELPRDETLRRLGECHALVHPSLHDSGGFVCLEAMVLGLPVICLDLGGPGVQVTEETGFKVPAIEPGQALDDLAAAMNVLSKDRSLMISLGQAAQSRASKSFNWHGKGARLTELYKEVLRS